MIKHNLLPLPQFFPRVVLPFVWLGSQDESGSRFQETFFKIAPHQLLRSRALQALPSSQRDHLKFDAIQGTYVNISQAQLVGERKGEYHPTS